MARTARLRSSTGIYHVMMRGINKQDIFFDDSDRDRFLDIVKGVTHHVLNLSGRPSGKYEVYAYALMGNHFHALVRVVSGNLSEFIKKIAAGYVMYFNKKYNRDGHLFRERFRSEPCENLDYFCVVFGYIHQNPVKHGFTKEVRDYKYTSWHEYFNPGAASHKVCDVDTLVSKMPLDKLSETIEEMVPINAKCIDNDKFCGQLSDDCIIDYLKEKHGVSKPHLVKECKNEIRKEIVRDLLDFGAGIRQLSRIIGIDKTTISRLK